MSQRILIVGVSESGKSSLARSLIKDADGLPVYVRDPIGTEWDAAGFFETSEELRALIRSHGAPAIVIIDESVDFFRVGQVENHWIFTRGRHQGLLPVAIAHRVKMIAPNVRAQATDLYVFNSAREDAETLAQDYNEPRLVEACDLSQGEFLHSRWSGGKKVLTRHRLW